MFWSPTKAPGVLAPEHGYVLLVLVTTWFVHNGWMASKVMAARKKHNIKYPTLYAVGDRDSDKKYVIRPWVSWRAAANPPTRSRRFAITLWSHSRR